MQLGYDNLTTETTTKAADIGTDSSIYGVDGTYGKKKTETSQPPQEYQSSYQEPDSMDLDVFINSNSDYSNINDAILGTANAASSLNIVWEKTTVEERTEYVNEFLKNVQEEYNLLEEQYKNKYGKGIDVQEYSDDSLDSVLALLNCGKLYNFIGVGTLLGMYNGDGNLDIEILGQIVEKVKELGYIEKMQAYLNGASWEECGLSTIYTNSEYGDPEQLFLYNICYSYGDIAGYYDFDDQDIDIKAVKEKLKDYFNSNDTFNTFSNIQNTLIDAQTMQNDLRILKMDVYRIEQMAKLFPFEAVEENPDFLNYLEKDYTNYTRMNQNNLHYLNQREVAIYDYLYDKTPSDAQKYLIALEDTINQRKGMEEAAEFINSIAKNGGDVGDLFITGWEGLEDGTVNFVDGIIDFFTADGVINASEYEMMYKASILSSALQDSENFTEELKNASKEYIENIPGWYRSVLNFNYSSWQSIGNMLIPSVVSFIPVVGKPIGLASMGISSAGNAAEGAMQNGASGAKAYLYGLGVGLSETVLTNFIGGIPGLSNLSESFIKNAANEAYEEFLQTWIDTGLRAAIFQEPINLEDTAFESLYSALQGFVVSGMMQGGQGLAFKIGNEIVYWSDSEFNSLTELLQAKQFSHDMELAQDLYKLYQEGTISKGIYKLFVSSELRSQIESPNGEVVNSEGFNNDSIVNVDNNLANTIESLEEETPEEATNTTPEQSQEIIVEDQQGLETGLSSMYDSIVNFKLNPDESYTEGLARFEAIVSEFKKASIESGFIVEDDLIKYEADLEKTKKNLANEKISNENKQKMFDNFITEVPKSIILGSVIYESLKNSPTITGYMDEIYQELLSNIKNNNTTEYQKLKANLTDYISQIGKYINSSKEIGKNVIIKELLEQENVKNIITDTINSILNNNYDSNSVSFFEEYIKKSLENRTMLSTDSDNKTTEITFKELIEKINKNSNLSIEEYLIFISEFEKQMTNLDASIDIQTRKGENALIIALYGRLNLDVISEKISLINTKDKNAQYDPLIVLNQEYKHISKNGTSLIEEILNGVSTEIITENIVNYRKSTITSILNKYGINLEELANAVDKKTSSLLSIESMIKNMPFSENPLTLEQNILSYIANIKSKNKVNYKLLTEIKQIFGKEQFQSILLEILKSQNITETIKNIESRILAKKVESINKIANTVAPGLLEQKMLEEIANSLTSYSSVRLVTEKIINKILETSGVSAISSDFISLVNNQLKETLGTSFNEELMLLTATDIVGKKSYSEIVRDAIYRKLAAEIEKYNQVCENGSRSEALEALEALRKAQRAICEDIAANLEVPTDVEISEKNKAYLVEHLLMYDPDNLKDGGGHYDSALIYPFSIGENNSSGSEAKGILYDQTHIYEFPTDINKTFWSGERSIQEIFDYAITGIKEAYLNDAKIRGNGNYVFEVALDPEKKIVINVVVAATITNDESNKVNVEIITVYPKKF